MSPHRSAAIALTWAIATLAQAAGVPLPATAAHGVLAAGDLIPVQSPTSPYLQKSTADDLRNFVLTSVKAFGAKGDGVTDDTAAIQSAINSCLPIYLPPGIYKISSTLRIESYCDNGQLIRGSGSWAEPGTYNSSTPNAGAAVIRPTSAVATMFSIDGTPAGGYQLSWVQGFDFENIVLDMTNMPDSTSATAISQVQAWDSNYRNVRVINYGVNKSGWKFTGGAFTTHCENCQGGWITFSGVSTAYATTTVTFTNCDVGGIRGSYYQNITFTGGSIQTPYVAGTTPITYLPPGTTPYAFPPNTTGIYVAVVDEIEDSLQFSSVGTDWELATSIPATCSVPGWSFGTYNDGTHGCLPEIAVVKIDPTAVNTVFINPTFAAEYPYDLGANTRIIGQPLGGGTGVDIHNGESFEQSSFGIQGTLFGYTNLASELDYGTTTTWACYGSSGQCKMQSLVEQPATDGVITAWENAGGTGLGYIGTTGTPAIVWYGLINPQSFQTTPTNAAGNFFTFKDSSNHIWLNCYDGGSLTADGCAFNGGQSLTLYQDTGGAHPYVVLNGNTGQVQSAAEIYPGAWGQTQSYGGLLENNGNPSASVGNNGDFYFRADCTHGSSDCLWHKEAGSWYDLN